MSTFNGRFPEIPGVSADRFDAENRESSAFFLSHCHTDHMVGLDHKSGLPGWLYLSEISAVIVRRLFPQIQNLVTMRIGDPTLVSFACESNVDSTKRITVTAVSAGHCPGSVMFIFEDKNLRLLYTGDFRLNVIDIQRFPLFKNVPTIDIAYIDSTFFSRQYRHFPTQNESCQVVVDLIRSWLNARPSHQVLLQLSARYGYEFLFAHIHKQLVTPIHVNANEMTDYRYIPELDGCVTTNAHATRIHACFKERQHNSCSRPTLRTLPCDPSVEACHIRVIKPSAMIWTDWTKGDSLHRAEEDEFHRVCYSNHASWNEIRDIIKYLRPKRVELNVLPAEKRLRVQMVSELQTLLASYQRHAAVRQIENNISPILDLDRSMRLGLRQLVDVTTEDSDEEQSSLVFVKRRRKN